MEKKKETVIHAIKCYEEMKNIVCSYVIIYDLQRGVAKYNEIYILYFSYLWPDYKGIMKISILCEVMNKYALWNFTSILNKHIFSVSVKLGPVVNSQLFQAAWNVGSTFF